jgi:hypothetical protein
MDLASYLRKTGIGPVGFAARVGVHYESIRRYGTGELMPRAMVAEKIRKLTGGQVRVDDFHKAHVAWQKKAARSAARVNALESQG